MDLTKFWIRIRWDVTAIALEHRKIEIFEIAPEIFEIAPEIFEISPVLRYINQFCFDDVVLKNCIYFYFYLLDIFIYRGSLFSIFTCSCQCANEHRNIISLDICRVIFLVFARNESFKSVT